MWGHYPCFWFPTCLGPEWRPVCLHAPCPCSLVSPFQGMQAGSGNGVWWAVCWHGCILHSVLQLLLQVLLCLLLHAVHSGWLQAGMQGLQALLCRVPACLSQFKRWFFLFDLSSSILIFYYCSSLLPLLPLLHLLPLLSLCLHQFWPGMWQCWLLLLTPQVGVFNFRTKITKTAFQHKNAGSNKRRKGDTPVENQLKWLSQAYDVIHIFICFTKSVNP